MRVYPHNMGAVGECQMAAEEILFNDYTGIKEIVTLPANCLINRVVVEIEQPFNAGTTNIITVGTNSDCNDLIDINEVNEQVEGFYEPPIPVKIRTKDTTTVKMKYAQAGTAPTRGKATAYVYFVRLK